MTWHPLYISHGLATRAADLLTAAGSTSYCPRYTIKRRLPHNRRQVIEITQPMLGRYFFAQPCDLEPVRQRGLRIRWLRLGDQQATMTDEAMTALRQAEAQQQSLYRPFLEDIIGALKEISRGAKPRRYVRLGDFTGVAA